MNKSLIIFYTLLFLIMASCAPKNPGTTAKLKLFSGRSALGIVLNGGVLVVARDENRTTDISFILNSSTEEKTVELPRGKWEFTAIGWTGENGKFTGSNKCEHTSLINLDKAEQTIILDLSTLKCAQPVITDDNFVDLTTGLFQSFKVNVCNASALSLANCPGNIFNTAYKSYRVNLHERPVGPSPALTISSECYSVIDNSGVMKLPVGTVTNKSPARFSLSFFTDTACAVGEKNSLFPQGLINPPVNSNEQAILVEDTNVTTLIMNPSIVQPIVPLAPTSFTATSGQNNIQLNWTASSGQGTIVYTVLRSITTGTGYSAVSGCTSISGIVCSDTTILTDTIYYYIVRASNEGGSSFDSSEVSGHTLAPPSSLSLNTPSTSPNNIATPLITVSGVVSGETVTLYSDSGCTVQMATGVASGTFINLTTSTLTDGSYSFYAKRSDATAISSCSSATIAYVLDTAAPTVAIGSASPAYVNSSYSVTFTFSETVSNFLISDISVTNGTASGFSGSGSSYTATIAPTSEGVVSVNVPASVAQDSAGNNNTASNTLNRTYDSIVPTVISVNSSTTDGTYGAAQTISIQINFSEAVVYTGSVLDLALNTGASANYTSGSGTTTLTFTYTVAPNEFSTDLEYTSTSALVLTGGLADSAGNGANLILPTTGATGSLGFNKNIIINAPFSLTVAKVYPTNGTNWNDYVQFGADVACAGTETGYYGETGGCVHGGEKLKVVVTGYNSCANLTITDSLGAFDWKCDATSGTATFYSRGLKPKKGLRDLITGTGGAGAWINNSVTVQLTGSTVGISTPGAWWTNPITEAPATDAASSVVTSLSTAGTVYYIHTSRQYYLLDITADKIAFITLGSAVLSANNNGGGGAGVCNMTTGASTGGTILSLVCMDAIKHLWLEGSFTSTSGVVGTVTWLASTGVKGDNIKYSRFNNVSIDGFHRNLTHAAINLTNSSYNLITETEIHAASAGVYLSGSTYNIVRGVKVGNIGGTSEGTLLTLTGTANYNRFYDLTLMNSVHSTTFGQGISLAGANNIFQRVMISDIYGSASVSTGVKLTGATGGNIFVQLGTFSSQNAGMNIIGASNNIISHVTAANHFSNGIYFSGANSTNYFQSIVVVNTAKGFETAPSGLTGSGNIFRDIVSTNNTTYGFDMYAGFGGAMAVPSYVITGTNGTSDCTANVAVDFCTPTPISGADLATAFVGKVTTNDISNTADTAGLASTNTTLSDWLYFDNWLRGWGKDGIFPSTGVSGYATSPYRIWDWRVVAGGSLHNKSFDGVNSNGTFTPAGTCPAAVDGNQSATHNSKTFLTHALEIDGDEVGNDNGLCESNEACIYAPNVGAYQGEGTLTGSCNFTNGTVTGVTMYSHSTTGI